MIEPPHALPDVDFATFILSLGTSVLLHLGALPEEAGTPSLPLAKQTIDIIAMLAAKTKGNLTEGEERLIQGLLYDLRVQYVDAQAQK